MSIIEIPGNDLVEVLVRPIAWPEFRKEVLAHYKLPRCGPQHRNAMIRMLDAVEALEPAPATTAELTVALVGRLLDARVHRAETPRTKIGLLRCLSAAATIAVERGHLARSPFQIKPVKRWIPRPGKPSGRRHLTRLELATLLDHLKRAAAEPGTWSRWKAHRIYAMVAVAAYTGIRAGELEYLEVADIDLERRILHVRPKAKHRLKTDGSDGPVPMPRALVPIVAEWLKHRLDPPTMPPADRVPWLFPGARGIGPWTGGPPGAQHLDVLQAAGIAAGIGHVTWQMLRRSLATHLRAFGVSSGMASQILRHSESVDEVFYNQPDEDNLRDAVADVEF